MGKRVLSMSVLPGEPLDGSGRVCIHLFVQDSRGPFVESCVLHPGKTNEREIEARPTRGRLACDRKRTVAPVTRNGVTTITHRTEDPRGVTCQKCLASVECVAALERLSVK